MEAPTTKKIDEGERLDQQKLNQNGINVTSKAQVDTARNLICW
jgi:hypothetical protein